MSGTEEGRVEAIWVKRVTRGPMTEVETASLVAGQGIDGNANQGGRRQVTLISKEAWARAEAELGTQVEPASRRANVLLSGIDLEDTRDRVIRVGDCRIHIRGETRPCTLMDDAHPGLRDALDPEWRGGAFGVVLDDGRISVGDTVAWTESSTGCSGRRRRERRSRPEAPPPPARPLPRPTGAHGALPSGGPRSGCFSIPPGGCPGSWKWTCPTIRPHPG